MEWRGGGAALDKVRRSTETALDQLKDAFWQLDSVQRFARAQVQAYIEHLPERARRSSLQPGFRLLDQRAEQCVVDYLAAIDKFPIEPGLRERTLVNAQQVFCQLEPRLRQVTEELDRFLESHAAELALVGKRLRKIEEQKRLAQEAAQEAAAVWDKLRRDGLGSASADRLMAEMRVATQGVQGWQPAAGLPALAGGVELVLGFAADLRKVATDFPSQVERTRRRAPSLRTRIDAIATRSAGIAESLSVLRREFSLGNWSDLDASDRLVAKELSTARSLVDQLQVLVANETWEEALTLLAQVESTLEKAEDAVDAPRERLALLQTFRANPGVRMNRTRFAIRDAQVMIVTGSLKGTSDLAGRLDALARRLDGLRPLTEETHPDYWSILSALDEIERQVHDVVVQYRSRAH